MKTRNTLLIAALMLIPTLRGQEVHAQSLALALVRLGASRTDTAKENALFALLDLGAKGQFPVCSPNASTETRRALIKALETENELINNEATPIDEHGFSETETEYYANVIGCVAALRDPAALRALFGAIETGGGAVNGIAVLGEAAVPGLLALFDASKSRSRVVTRMGAVMAAGKIASRNAFPQSRDPLPQVSATSLAGIRVRLLQALTDESRFVRAAAINGLASYSDAGVRQAIIAISQHDSATIDLGGKKSYPVRGAARDWLKQDSLKGGKLLPEASH